MTSAAERKQYLEYGAEHTPSDLPQSMETMWAAWNFRLTADFDELLTRLREVTTALMALDMGKQPAELVKKIERANKAIKAAS